MKPAPFGDNIPPARKTRDQRSLRITVAKNGFIVNMPDGDILLAKELDDDPSGERSVFDIVEAFVESVGEISDEEA